MNDERIITLLENIQAEQQGTNKRLDKIEGKVGVIEGKIGIIETEVGSLKTEVGSLKAEQQNTNKRLDKIEDNIEIIKENVEETRSATNKLLEWADVVEHKVKVPLLKFK